jgi:tRNA modification GTPase
VSESHTYAACLTPPGAGAIAVIAVRGPDAWRVAGEAFRRAGDVSPPVPAEGRFYLGRFGDELADQVVLSIRQMTPVPWLELHCHGGAEVVRLCLECLARRGVEVCTWRDLQPLTVDKPIRAAAASLLAEAPTVRTAGILLDQYHGAIEAAFRAIISALEKHANEEAGRLLDELIDRIPLGCHLVAPWRVVIAGAPNVGKSSLVNALAGYQRSVVSATPGTTRDVVTTCCALDGWPVELADTAGLRTATTDLEGQGIDRARAAAGKADQCLWVLDGSEAPVWPAAAVRDPLLVINKVDLPPAWDWQEVQNAVRVSALTGAGLPELCAALAARLVPRPPPAGSGVPFTAASGAALMEARRLLQTGDLPGASGVLRQMI